MSGYPLNPIPQRDISTGHFGIVLLSRVAPHLSVKGRRWFEIEMEEFEEFKRPVSQGGIWYLANKIKILTKV